MYRKCHSEIPFITIIKKQFFKKRKEWKVKELLWYKKRVKEGDYGKSIMYSCMKREQWDLLQQFWEWGVIG
jgi:uncharacterized phage-like protein YoqJ